jgi:hypothetical protein
LRASSCLSTLRPWDQNKEIMLGLHGIVTAFLVKRLGMYMCIYARARSITINLPNANENNAGLRGSLDLDLLMRRVRRRCFRRLLKSHFGGWRGSMAGGTLKCDVPSFTRGSRVAEAVISVPIKFGLRLGLGTPATIVEKSEILTSTTPFFF